jgi:hypothetical protein
MLRAAARAALTMAAVAAAAPAQPPVWSPVPGVAATQPGFGQMVCDTSRQRLVLISNADIHECDRAAWRRAAPGISLFYATSAFDSVRGVTVSFGGSALFSVDATTREWNGTALTVRSPLVSPPGRQRAAMAFDRQRTRIVLFGGSTLQSRLADTWEYDGVTWTPGAAGLAPPARDSHAMTFDVARGVTVLVGGSNATAALLDTWEWNGIAWTQHANAPSSGGALAYDEVRSCAVLLSTDSSTITSSTWERVGTTWILRQSGGPLMGVFYGGAFDPVVGRVVTVAEVRSVLGSKRLWSWDGAAWVQMTEPDSPLLLDGVATARCPLRQSIVRYGAFPSTLGVGDQATWEWRGGIWRVVPTAISPPLLFETAMAPEPGGTVLLFGGGFNSVTAGTWRFTGSDWLPLLPATSPPPRWQHGMALDTGRGRIVLFGGADFAGTPFGDTWEWDGSNWLPQAPPPRANPAMSFEPGSGRTLLFGGGLRTEPSLGDFWAWNGSTWQALPTGVPTARGDGHLAFDPVRQRTVLAGGFDYQPLGLGGARGSFEWDGAAWTTISSTQPLVQLGNMGGFDEALDRFVLFDTSTGTVELAATPSPAATTPFGTPCAGSSGEPQLASPWVPRAGNPFFGLRLASLLPRAFALLGLGTTQTSIPLGGGCTLLVGSPLLLTGVADGAGAVTFALPLPTTPVLHGGVLFAQGAGLDANGPFANLAVFSNGLAVTID